MFILLYCSDNLLHLQYNFCGVQKVPFLFLHLFLGTLGVLFSLSGEGQGFENLSDLKTQLPDLSIFWLLQEPWR